MADDAGLARARQSVIGLSVGDASGETMWRREAQGLFGGRGSYGNGAAMRASPIGAYFRDDLERVRDEAVRSAEPTHAHADGVAGAVAVAVAVARSSAIATRSARSSAASS
jgi:ADP-ribosylglycohydrolase|nr:ADP-ribosylglycohydrolase family protein [Kofleriaceae bacterium]